MYERVLNDVDRYRAGHDDAQDKPTQMAGECFSHLLCVSHTILATACVTWFLVQPERRNLQSGMQNWKKSLHWFGAAWSRRNMSYSCNVARPSDFVRRRNCCN